MRLIITGVASTAMRPEPTRGAVCSGATTSSAAPVSPGWMASRLIMARARRLAAAGRHCTLKRPGGSNVREAEALALDASGARALGRARLQLDHAASRAVDKGWRIKGRHRPARARWRGPL